MKIFTVMTIGFSILL